MDVLLCSSTTDIQRPEVDADPPVLVAHVETQQLQASSIVVVAMAASDSQVKARAAPWASAVARAGREPCRFIGPR